MSKIAKKYIKPHPWKIIEEGFDKERAQVSESLFSIANEYMGVRGYFEEGYSGDSLLGSYVNGVYEVKKSVYPAKFKGFSERLCYMVNTVDWLYTRIKIDGMQLDLAKNKVTDFVRVLDMKTGEMSREFNLVTDDGKTIFFRFERILSMKNTDIGFQNIYISSKDFNGNIQIESGLDFTPLHQMTKQNLWTEVKNENNALMCRTANSNQYVAAHFTLNIDGAEDIKRDKYCGQRISLDFKAGQEFKLEKKAAIHVFQNEAKDETAIFESSVSKACFLDEICYADALGQNKKYWQEVWDKIDVEIDGNVEDQQGVRFCIFNLYQTYHGDNPTLNIAAKGLSGENYYGWYWWDTETYCMPFYIFSNPEAAKSLLMYRYNTLEQAKERAIEMDCKGACYPMCTIDGTESCNVWQHGNFEIHVSAAVFYGIYQYMNVCRDHDFMRDYGAEMLVEISRYYASRGAFGGRTQQYGFYGVMGPDEFHMNVDNNCYTNLLAKKAFDYTLDVLDDMKKTNIEEYEKVICKTSLNDTEKADWKNKAENMYIPYDDATMLFEQHDGYHNLPDVDISKIPVEDYPLYVNWEYGRIMRSKMTKQPDVLLFMLFFSSQFTMEQKKKNFDYYEPKCSHESSLSPSIHSILAAEVGNMEKANELSMYAARLDLDDYNRNAKQGLHITSMAATWMTMVYGFGGMRTDGKTLSFCPQLPEKWSRIAFKVVYMNSVIEVEIAKDYATFKCDDKEEIPVKIFGKAYKLGENELKISTEKGAIYEN